MPRGKRAEMPETIPQSVAIGDKTFEFLEKSVDDHIHLFETFPDAQSVVDELGNKHLMERNASMCFSKGARITIEADVVDSLFTTLLFKAMYASSRVDGNPLHVLGLSIVRISYQGAANFSEQEQSILREAAALINRKLFPNEKEGA